MCILFVHVNPNPQKGEYRLIVASNRDEHYVRPAKDAQFSPENHIIAGVDMEPGREGGMWLGIKHKTLQKTLCFAALVNVTGAKVEKPTDGRGCLVLDYLNSTGNAENYLADLKVSPKKFNGFNFVAIELSHGTSQTYVHCSSPQSQLKFYGKQTLGFGNSPPCTPLNKVTSGRQLFEQILSKNLPKNDLIDELISLLKNPTKFLPDKEMQARAPSAYEFLSSIFVEIPMAGYGTRAHSVVLVDENWNIDFVEHAMKQPIDINNVNWSINHIKSNL